MTRTCAERSRDSMSSTPVWSTPVPCTQAPIDILDLGAGTGLELEGLFARAPNAVVTVIDISAAMLDLLVAKYQAYSRQIRIVCGSYLTLPLGVAEYDYAMSVMSLHHFDLQTKTALYQRICEALKDEGTYVEGDRIVPEAEEQRLSAQGAAVRQQFDVAEVGTHHVDIPFSSTTQEQALRTAGFADIDTTFRTDYGTVVVARKGRSW